MNNVIKKIAAVAMAFTLLGTGTAVTKTINPKFDTAITANAACKHNCRRFASNYGSWQHESYEYGFIGTYMMRVGENQKRTVDIKCAGCNTVVDHMTEHRYDQWIYCPGHFHF